MFYWFLKWIALGPLLRVVFRPQTEGAEHVPAEGPAILASNHLSYADWLFMPLTLPRRVTFVAKAEYFTGKGLKGWLQKTFFSGSGQVPIDRSGADAAAGALLSAKRVLGEGGLFGIYPEGTRSHDGKLYRGKTGVARLALETGVPVIPVAVGGTDVVAPPGKKFGSFTRPVVRFGKPLDFSRYEGLENDRYILRSITDEIMYEIMRLSGQEYVDMYATRAKELSKSEAAQAAQPAPADGERKASCPPRLRGPGRTRRPASSRTGSSAPWRCCGWSWSPTPSASGSTPPTRWSVPRWAAWSWPVSSRGRCWSPGRTPTRPVAPGGCSPWTSPWRSWRWC